MSAPAAAELSPVRVRRAPALEPPFDDEARAAAPAQGQPLTQPGRGARTQRPITPRQPRGPLTSPPAGSPAGAPAAAAMAAATAAAGSAEGARHEVKVLARPALAPVPAPARPAPAHRAPARPVGPAGRPAAGPASLAYRHSANIGPAHRPTPAQAAAQRFIGVCVEILNGHRPVNHLRAVVAAGELHLVTDQLVRRTNRAYLGRPGATSPRPHRVRLRALRVSEPLDGVAEIVAVLEYGVNHWAMCARLERRSDTWLCTLIQVI